MRALSSAWLGLDNKYEQHQQLVAAAHITSTSKTTFLKFLLLEMK